MDWFRLREVLTLCSPQYHMYYYLSEGAPELYCLNCKMHWRTGHSPGLDHWGVPHVSDDNIKITVDGHAPKLLLKRVIE